MLRHGLAVLRKKLSLGARIASYPTPHFDVSSAHPQTKVLMERSSWRAILLAIAMLPLGQRLSLAPPGFAECATRRNEAGVSLDSNHNGVSV
jgi:hypothetical protein